MAKKKSVGGKRADGEGSFTQRADGLWQGRISLGRNAKGANVRKSVYGKTLKEVRDKCEELRKLHESGFTNEKIGTVAEYLDQWIADDVKVSRGGNKTIREYTDTCNNYIKPYIGKLKFQKLTTLQCKNWQGELQRAEFTPNMRTRSMRVFSVAINAAIDADVIQRNPLKGVPRPKVVRRDINPLTPEQCEILFHECQKHRLGGVIILAVMTGMRKGEIFALQWEDINIAESVLALRRNLEEESGKLRLKEPKTKQGRRAIVLDELGTQCLASRRKKAIDEGFTGESGEIVFCSRNRKHMRQSNFDRNVWYPIREKAGISEDVHFHDLRHTQATLMLAAGIHPKIVQERLGHADISITMNTYSHLLAGMQADAATKMGAMIPRKKRDKAEVAE